jgi:hypothetical protein
MRRNSWLLYRLEDLQVMEMTPEDARKASVPPYLLV